MSFAILKQDYRVLVCVCVCVCDKERFKKRERERDMFSTLALCSERAHSESQLTTIQRDMSLCIKVKHLDSRT